MDRTLTNLIKALRSADVPVSIGESIDALKTVSVTGYQDRQFLKDSLSCVVAKTLEEKQTFDHLFDLYFSRSDSAESKSSEESRSDGKDSQGQMDAASELMDMLEGGDQASLDMAMEQAAERAGVDNIQFSTQRGFLARRMLDEMGLRELEERLFDLRREGGAEAEEEIEALNAARARLLAQARDFVDKQFEVFGEAATERFMEDYIQKARLTEIDTHDLERLERLIKRIAKRLAAKHSRRRKARNRGKLDIRKTMRANAAYEGVPFKTVWKQKRRERAKVVAICDVSGSVAAYARFLLMLLYSLSEAIPEIRSFAFSHKLVEISDNLENLEIGDAVKQTLKDVGQGSTDYGEALNNLQTNHWEAIDRRTTVIILGDGRSNYGNPRIDIMRALHAQAKRVIWLCPEPPTMWGSGDSEMPRFAPFCHLLQECRTVKDLERVVDLILQSYSQ